MNLRKKYIVVFILAATVQAACGKLPSALSSGNDSEIEGQGVKHEYLPVYSSIGASTDIVVSEHFVTVVSFGQTMVQNSFSTETYDINNGMDLAVPEFLQDRNE